MKGGLARFWYRLKNQFLRKQPELREPPRFLSGSKGELRQVTTWVCHLYPHFFTLCKEGYLAIYFWSRCGDRPGYSYLVHCESPFDLPEADRHAADSLLELALLHNEFVFTIWAKTYDISGNENSFCEIVEPPSVWTRMFDRNAHFYETPDHIVMKVMAPSAHERAEALLALSDWLDGKVSEQEKRELLQLPDDVKI